MNELNTNVVPRGRVFRGPMQVQKWHEYFSETNQQRVSESNERNYLFANQKLIKQKV
jgi:hypothetical protein